MRLEAFAAALLLALGSPAAAQFPGALSGVVTDGGDGAPIAAALVEMGEAGRSARTDAAGAFVLRGLDAGTYEVWVRRAGYAPRRLEAVVHDGQTRRLDVSLMPLPLMLDSLRVASAPDRAPGEVRLSRPQIEASGARTLADLLERTGAAVVSGTGPTSERRVSIRGGSADAVLVLVDGVPANDAVTGEADLSQLPASSIERLTVLSGARSARYGPRAETGVILVETRGAAAAASATASMGSLGERSLSAEWGGGGVALGGHVRSLSGRFDFRAPFTEEPLERSNADLSEQGVWAAASPQLSGGELRLRAGWDALDRGIPGRSYRPSPHARQSGERLRGSAAWRKTFGSTSLGLAASGELRGMHFDNPAPADSFPYDSRVRARTATLRAEVLRGAAGALRGWGLGADAAVQHLEAGSLTDAAPRTRTDAGVWGTASAGRAYRDADLGLAVDLRVDRDGIDGKLRASHTVSLTASRGPFSGRIAQRSAFSPPSLGDQFFREGVGVAPNPDLRAERIPAEWELSGSWRGERAVLPLEIGGSVYTADVRGMILWSPDFQGIWSPRNYDVRRRGAEAWARASVPAADLALSAEWSLQDVTYRWAGAFDPVQVVYRPRNAGGVRLAWAPGSWHADLSARYTGWRNPTPENSNRLPGFWTFAARVGRRWRVGRALLDTAVDVDRLGDERDALVFGHPEPGRRIRLDLRVTGAPNLREE